MPPLIGMTFRLWIVQFSVALCGRELRPQPVHTEAYGDDNRYAGQGLQRVLLATESRAGGLKLGHVRSGTNDTRMVGKDRAKRPTQVV